MRGGAPRATAGLAAAGCRAPSQRVHQVDHLSRCALLRLFDLLAMLFLLDQLPEGNLVVIHEFLGLEMPSLSLDDMDRQIEHVLGYLLITYIGEITVLTADFVGIAQRHAHHTLSAWLYREYVFPRCEHDATEGNHDFLLDGLTNHGEGLSADFAVGGDVVRNVPIELVDLASRHELVDLYRVGASERDGLQLFIGYFDVPALGDLKVSNDVYVADCFACDRIDSAVFDPVPGFPVDLMKLNLLTLREISQASGTRKLVRCDRQRNGGKKDVTP